MRLIGMVLLSVGILCAAGMQVARVAPRATITMGGRKPYETATIPLAVVSMNPLKNLMQMQDQRVARASQIVLAPGKCTLPLNEAIDLLKTWKAEIGDDEEKFAARAKTDSHCPTAATGGDLGFMVRGRVAEQFEDIIWTEEPGKVYGPITSPKGLHLLYLHSCRDPTKAAE